MKKENKWEENNIFFGDCFAFRASDKELLRGAFENWFLATIRKYGKSKWIECKMQTRLEK
jgi:hypothetical protein